MPSESKMLKRIDEYKTALGKKNKDLGEMRKGSVPGLVIAAGVPVSAASAYTHGYLDGKLATAKNQHPASIVGAVIGVLAAGGALIAGKPVAAALLADAASGPIDGLAWSKGREMGSASAVPAAAG